MFWRLHTAVLGHQLHEAFEFLRDLGDEVQIVTGPVLTKAAEFSIHNLRFGWRWIAETR